MKETIKTNGLGFLPILCLIFITLKLTGHISWSWWYVTMPLWGIPVFLILAGGVMFLITFAVALFGEIFFRK